MVQGRLLREAALCVHPLLGSEFAALVRTPRHLVCHPPAHRCQPRYPNLVGTHRGPYSAGRVVGTLVAHEGDVAQCHEFHEAILHLGKIVLQAVEFVGRHEIDTRIAPCRAVAHRILHFAYMVLVDFLHDRVRLELGRRVRGSLRSHMCGFVERHAEQRIAPTRRVCRSTSSRAIACSSVQVGGGGVRLSASRERRTSCSRCARSTLPGRSGEP